MKDPDTVRSTLLAQVLRPATTPLPTLSDARPQSTTANIADMVILQAPIDSIVMQIRDPVHPNQWLHSLFQTVLHSNVLSVLAGLLVCYIADQCWTVVWDFARVVM